MKNLRNYKNIIFDLGNVLLDIDPTLSERAFAALGLTDFGKLYSLAAQTELFDELEKGLITPSVFYERIRALTRKPLTDKQIEDCWNALIIGIPAVRIELLQSLRRHFRTFILSNTNVIHYDCYTGMVRRQYGVDGFEALVERAFFSFELGMRKPAAEIFVHVVASAVLLPSETLLIDDNESNIHAAQAIGFGTLHVGLGEKVEELLIRNEE